MEISNSPKIRQLENSGLGLETTSLAPSPLLIHYHAVMRLRMAEKDCGSGLGEPL